LPAQLVLLLSDKIKWRKFARQSVPQNAEFSETICPSPVILFRYSALTFNGHRIHYDGDYCREIEGYPGLVFHGPLTATLLANLAERHWSKPLNTTLR